VNLVDSTEPAIYGSGAGGRATPFDMGDTTGGGTFTPLKTNSNAQKLENVAAFTLGVPTLAANEYFPLCLLLVNGTGAGAITFDAAFTYVESSALTTNVGDKFFVLIDAFDDGGTVYASAVVHPHQ
jgi:hypothetical protein